MDAIEQLIGKLRISDPGFRVSGPQPEVHVRTVEQALGVLFPPDYRSFLLRFGALHLPNEGISGIWSDTPLLTNEGSVYGDTVRLRADRQLPLNFVVMESDDEAPYCLDTAGVGGVCPVVCYELAHHSPSRVAPTFEHFLLQWLQLRLLDT